MKLPLSIFCLIIGSLLFQPALAQDKTTLAEENVTFPASWQGQWQGELEIYSAKGLTQTVSMELHILPIENTENFTWTLIYGESDKRLYELQPIDPENGQYLIDEKNSIKIEAYYLGGILFSRFSAAGTLLLSIVEKDGDQLIFEFVSGKLDPVSTTGGEVVDGEEIFEVKTYPVGTRHRAVLQKIE